MARSVVHALVLAAFAFSLMGAAPTPVPMSRPDFSPMNFLLGTWTCHTMVRGKDRPDTSTTTVELDGAYMVTHDVAPAFDQYRSQPVRTDSYMTYNPRTRQWVTFAMDSFGGYTISSSPGWNGNALTTRVVMTQDGSSGNDTLTKVSDTQTRDVYTARDSSGSVTHGTVDCTKQ